MRGRLDLCDLAVTLSTALAGDEAAPAKSVLHAPDPWKLNETTTETATWKETVSGGDPEAGRHRGRVTVS